MLNIQINPSEMNHKNSLFMLNLQLSLKSECMLVICDISSKIFKLISIILSSYFKNIFMKNTVLAFYKSVAFKMVTNFWGSPKMVEE